MTRDLRPNEAIALALILVTVFGVICGWFLARSCRRVIDVEVHEMQYQRDLQAQRGRGGGT